ncbi:MAG: ornithine cyclodeaminase family protein [Devosia sp.]|uniref:NAD(P)-binding domain-containing protein n=1 Tax=Devosia sp. TaxID=1871048 RepID=UPI001AD20D7F|nr:NAD(P)-binding domain-containing protein [Devosia sp.]MBN9315210.1 ornithine cyclodeaminase family protein [Devosia sp.]
MAPIVLHDDDVRRLTDMPAAIAAVEAVIRAAADGAFVAPARHRVDFGGTTELVFAVGGSRQGPAVGGVRSYFSRYGQHFDDQAVIVWDMASGRMKGIVLGSELGVVRMGAIGGAAIRALARPEASTVALIGAGRQARSHLEAALATRGITQARVHSRSAESAERFAAEMSGRLGLAVTASASAEAAVDGADIVIVATTSLRPVLRAEWLAPDAFVHSVGYKSPAGKELGLDVAERAATLVTDSPQQVAAAGASFILSGTEHLRRLEPLSAFGPERQPSAGLTACYPMGLTGTDVVVADLIIEGAGPGRDPRAGFAAAGA